MPSPKFPISIGTERPPGRWHIVAARRLCLPPKQVKSELWSEDGVIQVSLTETYEYRVENPFQDFIEGDRLYWDLDHGIVFWIRKHKRWYRRLGEAYKDALYTFMRPWLDVPRWALIRYDKGN
jgi:hypothetical protein